MITPAPQDAAAALALAQPLVDRLNVAGIADFRAPPAQPTTCCGRGCNGCVWEGWFAAMAWWREDALERLAQA